MQNWNVLECRGKNMKILERKNVEFFTFLTDYLNDVYVDV